MAGIIPKDQIETVRMHSDIVEVIGSFIPLKKAGTTFFAVERNAQLLLSLPKEAMYWSTATWCWKGVLKIFLPIRKLRRHI